MRNSNNKYGCSMKTQEVVQENPDDPGPRRFIDAVQGVNGRLSLSM